MAGEKIKVTMEAGGPYGFRLFGGEDSPLSIAKLRKGSKAHQAGFSEGDILLGINGYSCQGISHGVAMGMVDNGGPSLSFDVLRGCAGKHAADAAFQELGSQLKPVPAHLQQGAQMSSQSPNQFSASPARVSPATQNFGQVSQPPSYMNGNVGVQRQSQTFHDGDTTRRVSTEKRTENFGGGTITRTTRQETSERSFGGPPAGGVPMFQVSNFTTSNNAPKGPKPWVPGGMHVNAPSGVGVQQNPDQSVTMTIGMGGNEGKENQPPLQMFKVPKVAPTENKSNVWKPGNIPQAVPRPREPSPPQPQYGMEPDYQMEQRPMGFDLARVLQSEGMVLSDGGSSSDGEHRGRKKKIYADSAFYDDPEHKYPTIEEQIKMAKKVALSLMAPQNKKARGHTMFMKRRTRSDKWTIDGDEKEDGFGMMESDDEKYYNPNPWQNSGGGNIWQPPNPTSSTSAWDTNFSISETAWSTPTLPVDDKAGALSAEEFERLRLHEQKNLHNQVAPQVCFNLAEDMKNMKGRGGKLFAKRKERSEKWVVDEDNVKPSGPDPAFLAKIGALYKPPEASAPQVTAMDTTDSGPPMSRLQQMIELDKASCTPWEAAAESKGGTIDRAFEHITKFEYEKRKQDLGLNFFPSGPKKHEDPLKKMGSLSTASRPGPAKKPPASMAASDPVWEPAKMPEFSAKIKPWQTGSSLSSGSGASFNPVLPSASQAASSGGYKPVSFNPGSGGGNHLQQPTGGFTNSGSSSPWQHQSPGGSHHSGSIHSFGNTAAASEGFCDL